MRKLTVVVYLMVCLTVIAFTEGQPEAEETGVQEISFWHTLTGLQGDFLDQTVALFNESQSDIFAVSTRVPTTNVADVSKLMASIAAGVGPDVFFVDRNTVSQRAYEGVIQDLEPYLNEIGWEDPESEYLSFVWPEVLWQDKVYALPFEADMRVMFYRADHFEAAGLDPDDPPKTLEELDQIAETLTATDAEGRLKRVGFVPWYGQASVYTWGPVYGASWFDFETKQLTANSPKMVDAVTRYAEYMDKYPGIVRFASGFGRGETDPFVSGLLSIIFNTDKYIAFINEYGPSVDYRVAPMPRPAELADEPVAWSGGFALSIPAGAKSPGAAMEFIRFMTGPEGQKYFCERNTSFPTNKIAFETTSLRDNPEHQVFFDLLPHTQIRPAIPIWGKLWPAQHAVRDDVINGIKTPKEALDEMVALIQPDIDYIFSLYE